MRCIFVSIFISSLLYGFCDGFKGISVLAETDPYLGQGQEALEFIHTKLEKCAYVLTLLPLVIFVTIFMWFGPIYWFIFMVAAPARYYLRINAQYPDEPQVNLSQLNQTLGSEIFAKLPASNLTHWFNSVTKNIYKNLNSFESSYVNLNQTFYNYLNTTGISQNATFFKNKFLLR